MQGVIREKANVSELNNQQTLLNIEIKHYKNELSDESKNNEINLQNDTSMQFNVIKILMEKSKSKSDSSELENQMRITENEIRQKQALIDKVEKVLTNSKQSREDQVLEIEKIKDDFLKTINICELLKTKNQFIENELLKKQKQLQSLLLGDKLKHIESSQQIIEKLAILSSENMTQKLEKEFLQKQLDEVNANCDQMRQQTIQIRNKLAISEKAVETAKESLKPKNESLEISEREVADLKTHIVKMKETFALHLENTLASKSPSFAHQVEYIVKNWHQDEGILKSPTIQKRTRTIGKPSSLINRTVKDFL